MNKENAAAEFVRHIKDRTVIAVEITNGDPSWSLDVTRYTYRDGDDFDAFKAALSGFEYNPSYGSQRLFGVIWYADGTWSERGEYDGSEWWEHRSCPQVPERGTWTPDNGFSDD